ncbi:MAG TPA: futalosine hydrolase [Puia sp.]|nr:futalosine hydrolase [Puia sp.]
MHILLAAATTFEIQPTIDALGSRPGSGQHRIEPLVTGVGGMATAWSLMRQIGSNRPDLIIQAGIAGTLRDRLPGEVLVVGEDEPADTGVWEAGRFNTIFDLQLADANAQPYTNGRLVNPHGRLMALTGLETVAGLTVNEITTSTERIRWYQQNTPAVVESMEGASLHYVCLQEHVPFLQLRSVSNAVGVRDKTQWDIRGAIASLNARLIALVEHPALEID